MLDKIFSLRIEKYWNMDLIRSDYNEVDGLVES